MYCLFVLLFINNIVFLIAHPKFLVVILALRCNPTPRAILAQHLIRILPGKLSRILHLGGTVSIIYNFLSLSDKEFDKIKI